MDIGDPFEAWVNMRGQEERKYVLRWKQEVLGRTNHLLFFEMT
jgi:hypothetical protein